MKDLMSDVSDKKANKQKAQNQTMRTEAVFTPSYPSSTTRTQPSATTAPKHNLEQELAELDQLQEQIQWVSSPMGSSGSTTSSKNPILRQAPKKTGQSLPPQQTQLNEYPPARKLEKNASPSSTLQSEQIAVLHSKQLHQNTSPSSDLSEKQYRKPKKSSKSREKSPPVREPKREKSLPAQQPKRAKSPPVSQSTSAVSPTSKEPGRLKSFFRRSKSPPLQTERSGSPPTELPVSSGDKFSVPLWHKTDYMPEIKSSGYVEERHKTNKMSFEWSSSKSPETKLPNVEDVTSGLSENSKYEYAP